MLPEFEQATFSQEVGVIGSVVRTKFGDHVIRVTRRTPGGVTPLAEVSGKIRDVLSKQGREKRFGAFLKGLRAKATIVYAETPKPVGLPPP